MKTTLNINEITMKRLKQESVRQGKTMSDLVELALRELLEKNQKPKKLPPLPSFDSGGALVDLANRDALYDQMEGS